MVEIVLYRIDEVAIPLLDEQLDAPDRLGLSVIENTRLCGSRGNHSGDRLDSAPKK